MEGAVNKFQSVVEADQQNGEPKDKRPLAENENPASRSNKEQDTYKAVKRQKGVEGQPIAIGVEAGAEACW